MNGYGGYIFTFYSEVQIEEFVKRIESESYFTSTAIIGASERAFQSTELCLLSFGYERIDYAALARSRGTNVATREFRVRFESFVELKAIRLDEIDAIAPDIGDILRQYWRQPLTRELKYLPASIWATLMQIIVQLRPSSADRIDDLQWQRHIAEQSFEQSGFEIMAQEKDAFGVSLEIFGAKQDREELSTWRPGSPGSPALEPFLVGLRYADVPEEDMIAYDAARFGDWDYINRDLIGAVRFKKRGKRLTIMNVNRRRIEQSLGVDLFYYHWDYQLYVMVQYKRMEPTRLDGFVYYPNSDRSHEKELNRMLDFELQHPVANQPELLPEEYRLHSGIFYFKLCPRIIFRPHSPDLIDGMYIPLDYWQMLLQSPATRGPRGGVRITRKNVDRYMNNTLFIDLVQHGWIGSQGVRTNALGKTIRRDIQGRIPDLVAQSIEAGKSVVLAASDCAYR